MPINKTFHVENEAAMSAVAADLAPSIGHGALLALEGNLGAGKTALARALIRHMAEKPTLEVPSPTFTLVQIYETPKIPIWHFDFYRLKHPEEVFELGWEDALASRAILIMEWAERIGPLLPPSVMHAVITPQEYGIRKVEIRG